jgi:hypothetical protein
MFFIILAKGCGVLMSSSSLRSLRVFYVSRLNPVAKRIRNTRRESRCKNSPDWIPCRIFLSYFDGMILILAGVSLLANRKRRRSHILWAYDSADDVMGSQPTRRGGEKRGWPIASRTVDDIGHSWPTSTTFRCFGSDAWTTGPWSSKRRPMGATPTLEWLQHG